MDNNFEVLVMKKVLQRELLNELYCNGVIDFRNVSNIIQKLDEDICKLKKIQENNKDMKNIVIKILI